MNAIILFLGLSLASFGGQPKLINQEAPGSGQQQTGASVNSDNRTEAYQRVRDLLLLYEGKPDGQ